MVVSTTMLQLSTKEVPDMLVASISFRGQRQQISSYIHKLYQQVKAHIKGEPLCLYHGGSSEKGFEMEICFPVSQPVKGEEIDSRILEGGWMISTLHHGPYTVPGQEGGLSRSWKEFYALIRGRNIGLAEGSPREVFLESALQHGEDAHKYVTELQEYLLLPRWLNRMAMGLDRLAGEEIAARIMEGSGKLTALSPARETMQWVKGAMERLEELVAEEQRQEIMTGCAHVFPERRIQQLRAEYLRLGDLDKLLQLMGEDRSMGEYSYYSAPKRDGHIIYTTKIPFNPRGCKEARDELERRYHSCHCPLVKEAIRGQVDIGPTFCYCGSGWFRRLWQGILQKPVKVEVLKTVLQGDECCQFAIHLPQEF